MTDDEKPPQNWFLLVLKVIGVIVIVFLVAVGIFLGTCMFITRGFR